MDELIPLLIFAILSAAGSWLQNRREKKGETSWEEVEGEPTETQRQGAPAESPSPSEPKRIEETIREALGIPSAEELKRDQDRPEPPAIPPSPRQAPQHPGSAEKRASRKAPGTRETVARGKTVATELKNAREASIESKEAELEAARAKREAARRERDRAIEKARAVEPATQSAPQSAPRLRTRRVSPRTIQTILRDPESAKTAFAASVVFGPPKGME